MKLCVRIQCETWLEAEEPRVQDLKDLIQETLLSFKGLSVNNFTLSLNASDLLRDEEEPLSSFGVESGDSLSISVPKSDQTWKSHDTTNSKEYRFLLCYRDPFDRINSSYLRIPSVSPDPQDSSEDVSPFPSSFIWEPVLCDEAERGQAPLLLERLYRSAGVTHPSDAIVVAAHLLMLETGFISEDSCMKPDEMPRHWRFEGGLYRLGYSHPLCEDSQISMMAVHRYRKISIAVHLTVNEAVHTVPELILYLQSHVVHSCPETAAECFKKLKKLSQVFKDELAYQVIAKARAVMSLPPAFGLVVLPAELILEILRLLDLASVLRLSSVCRRLHDATADHFLWRHLLNRDFPDPHRNIHRHGFTDWKSVYRYNYRRNRNMNDRANLNPCFQICPTRRAPWPGFNMWDHNRGHKHRHNHLCVRPPDFNPTPGFFPTVVDTRFCNRRPQVRLAANIPVDFEPF